MKTSVPRCTKVAIAATVVVLLIIVLSMCDIVFERNFIKSAKQLAGQNEEYVIRCYGTQYSRGQNISTLWRRRWLAPVWAMVGCDEGTALYLKMNKDKVDVVLFAMKVPSMRQQEL